MVYDEKFAKEENASSLGNLKLFFEALKSD
jgi:hypothetical protein